MIANIKAKIIDEKTERDREESFLEEAKERRWQEIQIIAEELKHAQDEEKATVALHRIELGVRFPWMSP